MFKYVTQRLLLLAHFKLEIVFFEQVKPFHLIIIDSKKLPWYVPFHSENSSQQENKIFVVSYDIFVRARK